MAQRKMGLRNPWPAPASDELVESCLTTHFHGDPDVGMGQAEECGRCGKKVIYPAPDDWKFCEDENCIIKLCPECKAVESFCNLHVETHDDPG